MIEGERENEGRRTRALSISSVEGKIKKGNHEKGHVGYPSDRFSHASKVGAPVKGIREGCEISAMIHPVIKSHGNRSHLDTIREYLPRILQSSRDGKPLGIPRGRPLILPGIGDNEDILATRAPLVLPPSSRVLM